MNPKIRANLNRLFNQNFELIKEVVPEQFFDDLIAGDFDEDEIEDFKKVRKNKELIAAIRRIQKMELKEEEIIESFMEDIKSSFFEIKEKVRTEKKGFRNQIIFLEYDFEPQAYFCGFGEGDYPVLEKPAYFDYNFREELYTGIGTVGYSKIWNDITFVNETLEDLDIEDPVFSTDFYEGLLNVCKLKTYLLLHRAFDEIGIELFEEMEIKRPLFIYGNEHDCEVINIYIFS